MNNEMQKVILEIMSSGLNEEQKEALLGEIANGIIEKKEDKREELIEKNRQQANETRQRLKEREKEAYRNEIIKNSDEKVEEYIKELSEVKNSNNEYIYKDLEQEYKNGKISKAEIYDLYERFFNKKQEIYKDVFDGIEETQKQENTQVESEQKEGLVENEDMTIIKDDEETRVETIPENQNENTDENFRELTYKEARSIVNYGNRLNNGELSEEEIIKYKPRLDSLMKETGAQDMNELYEKAREVVNKNKSNINSSTEKQVEFINKKDVSELNEEEKNHIRETLGLDDDEEITNDDLSKVQSEDLANNQEKRKPVKKISPAGNKLKEKIQKNGSKILKTVGTVVLLGVAIATGFTLVPGLAAAGAGALGVAAYQEFNKGKKL
ncbi:MAG: hypothetical protein ACI4PE_00885 [Bacilli bacterium]